jgi:hypothetical protein
MPDSCLDTCIHSHLLGNPQQYRQWVKVETVARVALMAKDTAKFQKQAMCLMRRGTQKLSRIFHVN